MKTSKYDPSSYDTYSQLEQNCPQDHWAYGSPSALTGIIPSSLLEKVYNIWLIHSADADNHYFVTVINRIDRTATALDQDLYVATFTPHASAAEGCFVFHGNWSGRTTPLANTALPNLPNMPSAPSGSLDQLGQYGNGLLNTGISAFKNYK